MSAKVAPEKIPKHVAIIMDGNGRWAKDRSLPRIRGHEEGAKAVRAAVEAASEMGISYLTVYAFSYENWQRPKAEVTSLMQLLERFLKEHTKELMENNIRLQAIGRTTDLPGACQRQLESTIEATSKNTGLTFIMALSYSGRLEILDAVRSLSREIRDQKLDPDALTPEIFSKHLYTRDFPDPDLLIRTSGELRLSNFLLWQLSYTEIWITRKLWPDFEKSDLLEAVAEYAQRHRRYGGV